MFFNLCRIWVLGEDSYFGRLKLARLIIWVTMDITRLKFILSLVRKRESSTALESAEGGWPMQWSQSQEHQSTTSLQWLSFLCSFRFLACKVKLFSSSSTVLHHCQAYECIFCHVSPHLTSWQWNCQKVCWVSHGPVFGKIEDRNRSSYVLFRMHSFIVGVIRCFGNFCSSLHVAVVSVPLTGCKIHH